MSDKDGGPAFGHGDPTHGGDPGMSLRDYFAGQALIGLLSNGDGEDSPDVSTGAYQIADAMLEARKP